MSFTIHSIGDSAFLEQILIAVKMVTGNGNFKMMIGIGLLLSTILVCLRSVFTNSDRVDYQQILVGWIVYQVLFVPTTTVTIQNAYTGEVAVVDNVPFGVGAAGGIISTIGYGITKIFDTGFAAVGPGITKSNFSESLSLLNDVRRQVHNASTFEALDKAGGGNFDFHGSWHNYIRECTLTKIDIQSTSLNKLMLQPIDQAVRFDSNLFTTLIKTGSNGSQQGTTLSCTKAYEELSKLTDLGNEKVEKAIGATLGFSSSNQLNTFNHIQNALQAVGASRTSAVDFVKASLLEPLYYEAAAGRYQDWQDYNSALMVNQAIQQRNTKWAAEQTMFMTIIRPMLTFFEGFIYAITPLMAFMIVMGNFGIQLLGKYLQTLFWIQLWMPVMSITNLFIHVAATRALAHLASSDAGFSSMYALDTVGNILQHWIATGGMLASATPMISLFIVSGSTYAMSGLAGRISTSEGIDTKLAAPNAVQQSPILASGPNYTQNSHGGMITTGTESLVPSMNFGNTLRHGLSNVSSQLSQSSQSFNQTLGRAINEGVSQEQGYARIADLGGKISAQNSEASEFVNEQAKSFSEKYGIHDSHQDLVSGTIAGTLSGSIGTQTALKTLGGLAANAKVAGEGKSSSTTQDSATRDTSDISQFVAGIKANSKHSQNLTNQLAQSFSDQNRQGSKEVWGETHSNNLARSASEVKSLSQTYSAISNLQNQMGTATQADLRTLAGAVNNDNNASSYLNDHFQNNANSKVRSEATDISNRYQNMMGMDPAIADTAGKMTALVNSSNNTPEEQLKSLQGVAKAIQMSMGYHPSLEETQSPLQRTEEGAPLNHLETKINEAVSDGPSYRNQEKIRKQANTQVPTDGKAVRGKAQEDRIALQMQKNHADSAFSSPQLKKAQSNLLHSLPEMSIAASRWGGWDKSTDWLCRRRDQLGGALFAGSEESIRAFNNSVEQLGSMTPQQREQFSQKASGGNKLGNTLLGAVTSGYSAAKEWLTGKSDLSAPAKEMSMEQRGAYYAAAFSAAADAGPKAAGQFMQEYGQEFKSTIAETAQNRYGLTPAQSAVYAESFDTNRERMAEAVQGLKVEYATMAHPREQVAFDENNQPILNQQDSKFTDQLVNVIQNATTAGDMSGSYLSSVRGFNIAAKNLNN